MSQNYIPDKEINLIEEDLLGTLPYVETLTEIIKTCNTPFTIGLLGGWGSGKSSIVKTLQEKFNNNPEEKIKVFIYDAWKYSKDSFRRTFILELKKFFNLDTTEEFESFYTDKHEEILGKVGLIKGWWGYLVLFLLPLMVINIKPFFIDKTFELTTFVISLSFSALMTFVAKTFVQYKISITKPRAFAPEQFEGAFRESIDEITGKQRNNWKWIKNIFTHLKPKKIVIAIDNIDRCHEELAIELLLTIKNFLEIENVIFVIPADEEGIKKYLRISDQDANEFLRKLFNTTIRIKKFTGADLFDFCKKLNKKYELNFPNTVLSIIAQEFAKNPRRIIQFLNNLQSEIILAKMAEERKLIKPRGVITGNVPMLAKLLIIKEEWPELYTLMGEDPNLLNRINRAFREKQFEKKGGEYKLISEDITLSAERYKFLLRTSTISAVQLEPFFVNRDVFIDIPDEINNLIISQDWDSIKEKYVKTGNVPLSRIIEFVSQQLDKEVIGRGLYQTSGFNILSLIFKIADDAEFSTKLDEIYGPVELKTVITVCRMGEIENLVFELNPSELVKFSRWLYDKGNVGLTDNIIKAINNILNKTPMFGEDKKEIKTIKAFVDVFVDKPEEIEKIKDNTSQILINNPELFEDLQEILENGSISKHLITDKLIENFVSTLQPNPNQDKTSEKVKILNALCVNETIPDELIISYIDKIVQFAGTNDWNSMNLWLNALNTSFGKYKKKVSDELSQKIYDFLNSRYQWLFSQYTARQISELSINCYKSFLNLCLLLYSATDKYDTQTMQWVNNFFMRNESPEIYLYINSDLYSEIVNTFEVYNLPFSQNIIDRFINIGWPQKKEFVPNLNSMLLKTTSENGLTPQQIDTILTHYLNIAKSPNEEQNQEAKNWLKEIIKNKFIIESLRIKIDSINNPDELRNLFDVILGLRNKELSRRVVAKIVLQIPCGDIENILRDLSHKANIKMIKEAVQAKVNQLNIENNNQDRECLGKVINTEEVIDETISKKIIDKLRPLLAGNNKEEQVFALKCIENLQEVPQSKKKLLKALVQEIKEEEWQEEEKEILFEIKKRLK
jgi:hypothetical protein